MVRLVCIVEVPEAETEDAAQRCLDNFRDSRPTADYGLTIYRATEGDADAALYMVGSPYGDHRDAEPDEDCAPNCASRVPFGECTCGRADLEALAFDEGAEGEHAARELGEDGERCTCPDGGQPVIPHGSGDADCAVCKQPWFPDCAPQEG